MSAGAQKRSRRAVRAPQGATERPYGPFSASVEESAAVVLSDWREADLLNYVLHTAALTGWTRRYHTTYSIKSAAGFPDLVLVNPTQQRVLYAELKREGLKPTVGRFRNGHWVEGQTEWLRDLLRAGAEAYWWCPSDARAIADILQHRDAPDHGWPCVHRLDEWLEAHPDPRA